ncbi:MAG TPA: TadE/TadG family type IV pilus assembly protein [Symbiobacteriaceae bacterium]|nr:TadE/TadG family type IV pilus assembly protein [Symbiobacteriaceae bacterium]
MKWRNESGQAALEMAIVIPVVLLMVLSLLSAGYVMMAQLMVVNSAGQGGRMAAGLCSSPSATAAEVLDTARQRALEAMGPLVGPKAALAEMDGQDLVVTSTYEFRPPLPGARMLVGDAITFRYSVRYRCGPDSSEEPPLP